MPAPIGTPGACPVVFRGRLHHEVAGQNPGLVFLPTAFADICAHLERKLEALGAYQEEIHAWPHTRSRRALEALAQWRGSSTGVEAAEAFIVMRVLT